MGPYKPDQRRTQGCVLPPFMQELIQAGGLVEYVKEKWGKQMKIAVIPGDGIGPEVVEQTIVVLNAVGRKFNHRFYFEEVLMGEPL